MAIIPALTLAKTYLSFAHIDQADVEAKVDNAFAPALFQFEQDQKRYIKPKNVPDTFDSVSVMDLGNDRIQVELAHSIIRRLYFGYELKVESGNYAYNYDILGVDCVNNTIILSAEYFDETITFFNQERQIYEGALAWYVCAFTRYTLQEVKECTYMASSTQLGNGSSTSYSVQTLEQFKKGMMKNAELILNTRKRFPSPL